MHIEVVKAEEVVVVAEAEMIEIEAADLLMLLLMKYYYYCLAVVIWIELTLKAK